MIRSAFVIVFVTSAAFTLMQCSSGTGSGGTGGGTEGTGGSSHTGGSGSTGGSNGGGSHTGGSGNTGGSGSTGGSNGGGSSTGGSNGGGSGGQSCDVASNTTCPSGTVCIINQMSGSTAGACLAGCDQADQDCTGGKKCTYVQVGQALERACVDAGTVAEDGACTNDGAGDDCQTGLFCLQNVCVQFCNLTTAHCAGGKSCSGLVNAQTEFPLICNASCNLLTQDCTGGKGCLPAQAGGTVCVPVGTADAGATCTAPTGCAVGEGCVQTSQTGSQCLHFCNLDGGSPACSGGDTCMDVGLAQAGFCG